jgi:hypothetical protein
MPEPDLHIFPTCKSYILHKAKAFTISRKVNFHRPYIRTYFSSTFHSLHMLSSAENTVYVQYFRKIKDKCTLHLLARSFIIVRMFSHLITHQTSRVGNISAPCFVPIRNSSLFIDPAGYMLFPVNLTMQRFTKQRSRRKITGM